MPDTMADEDPKAILGSAKLVEHGIGLLDTATSSLAAIMQPDSDAETLLIGIARRMEDLKCLLVQLRDAWKSPCACHSFDTAPDLQMCMVSCQLVCERLVSLAHAAAEADDNDTDSQLTLLDNAALTDGDNLEAVDRALEDIRQALALFRACKCNASTPRRSGRMLASQFSNYFKKTPLLPRAGRRLKLAAAKMSTALTSLRTVTPMSGLTPRCIAHKRAADAARRRSMAIDEQIAADSKQQVWMVPLYGAQEERMMLLDHFIARVPDAEAPSTLTSTDTIRRHLLKEILLLTTILADRISDESIDEVTDGAVSISHEICTEEDTSRFDDRFAENFKLLWSSPAAREILVKSRFSSEAYGDLLLTLNSSLVQAVERVSKPSYQPTTRECHRFASNGGLHLHKGSFDVEGMNISFVNASRWPRKSLGMHDCPCIVYVADLADYATQLGEDCDDTCLHRSIMQFARLLHSKAYKNTSSILILANLARFKESLKTKPLSKSFPEFQADSDPDEAVNYILQEFTAAKPTENEIYVHIGEVADASMFDFIASATKECLLQRAAGLP
ncbi:hypothetical protein GQ53DRAFT_801619 [Thozetella sp. PMI_491]|nr:hypothetical protein GQ53DRAFT_801619 [Thozetella sp. PMI_491]